MGHQTETRIGTGKNKEEAWASARASYQAEYGWSHSIREIEKATLVKKVPPMKVVRTERMNNGRFSASKVTIISNEPDESAPKDQWLEEWEFEFDVHI